MRFDDAGARFVRDIEGYVDNVAAASERMTIMLALAVNINDLVRFESVVPVMHCMVGGHYKWDRMQDASALTISDAAFAVDFATKFALAVQGRMPHSD
jgi:hypothetical protein